MFRWIKFGIISALVLIFCLAFRLLLNESQGISFVFKGETYHLPHKMKIGVLTFGQHPNCNNACLDTLCNRYFVDRHYVEIIRQDDAERPLIGLAIGFEFDEANGQYPYTPSYAVAQLKDFRWGGVEFSKRDTFNYTGVSNEVSDDLTVEVDSFSRDTIYGRFNGLLLSGAGPMAQIDSGYFKVKLYRLPNPD